MLPLKAFKRHRKHHVANDTKIIEVDAFWHWMSRLECLSVAQRWKRVAMCYICAIQYIADHIRLHQSRSRTLFS